MRKNPLKIVIALDLAPQKLGSLERSTFYIARLLRQSGFDVKCLFSGSLSPQVAHHFCLTEEQVVTNLGNLSDATARKEWIKQFQKESPDIVWLHFFPLHGLFLYQLKKVCARAAIYSSERVSRGYTRRNILRSIASRGRAYLFRPCISHHIAISDYIKKRLHNVDCIEPKKITTIYNGIDTKVFFPAQTEGSCLTVAAYLRPEKGIGVFLDALLLLREQQNLEPECKIVGVGPELETYQHFVHIHRLSNVSFLGLRDDMPEILRETMITIVPSLWAEAFSNVAAEAQATGVPVIASDVGGLPEVVQQGSTGILVTPNDAQKLADAISTLIKNKELRQQMGQAGRCRVKRLFDLNVQARQVTAFLTQGIDRDLGSISAILSSSSDEFAVEKSMKQAQDVVN